MAKCNDSSMLGSFREGLKLLWLCWIELSSHILTMGGGAQFQILVLSRVCSGK